MKASLVSFVVGLLVGVVYRVIRVKSPAPPIMALVGLLGMVFGEQLGGWLLAKNINLPQAASVCLVGKHWDEPAGSKAAMQGALPEQTKRHE